MVSPRRPRVSFAWRESNFRLARPRRISRPRTARPPTGTAFFAWHRWDVGLTIAGFVLGAIGTWLAVWATNEYFRPRIELQDRELISHPLASAFRISNRGNVAALWPWIKCTSVVFDNRIGDDGPPLGDGAPSTAQARTPFDELSPGDGLEVVCDKNRAQQYWER
jgi:hypothetical protein